MADEPSSIMRDAHTILGVTADAGLEAIKQAYRRRVRTVHPDLEPARGTDGSKFMELRRAYEELLSAREKTITPPRPGATPTTDARSSQGDLFRRFRPRRRELSVLRAEVELDLLDALQGCERRVNFRVHEDWMGTIEVSIAPGTSHGTVLECSELLPFSLAHRGLQVHVKVRNDPRWRRNDHDLCMRVPINLRTAYLGGAIEVCSPWQTNSVRVPPGTSSLSLRLAGQGVRRPGHQDGDLRVEIFVTLPPHANEHLRLALMWAQPQHGRRSASRAMEQRQALAAAMPDLHDVVRRRAEARPSRPSCRGRLECELSWTPGLSLRPRQLKLDLTRIDSQSTTEINITMRAGLRHGQVVRLPKAVDGRDLHIRIDLEASRRITFVRSDVHITLPIDIIDTFTGATIDVPTPDGWRSLTLNPGIQHGDRIKLTGAGLTDEVGRSGDVYFIVQNELPPLNDRYLAECLEQDAHLDAHLDVGRQRTCARTLALDAGARRHRPKWRVGDLKRSQSGDNSHIHTFVRGRRAQ